MYVDLQAVAVIYTKLLFSPDHARFKEIHTKAKFKLTILDTRNIHNDHHYENLIL